jgi:hypothetical protein
MRHPLPAIPGSHLDFAVRNLKVFDNFASQFPEKE